MGNSLGLSKGERRNHSRIMQNKELSGLTKRVTSHSPKRNGKTFQIAQKEMRTITRKNHKY